MSNALLPLREVIVKLPALERIEEVRRLWKYEEPDAAEYLRREPHLLEDKLFVFDLVLEEFVIRTGRGEKISRAEFAARFPEFRSGICAMLSACGVLDVHQSHLDKFEVSPPWPACGTKVGDLELIGELGQGAFAHVYLARELSAGGRLVAAKFTCDGPNEARTLGPLSHRHIVRVLSAGVDPSSALHVVRMPYHGSATLADLLAHVYPPGQTALPRDARVILEAAHAKDVAEETGPPPAVLQRGSYSEGVVWLIGRIASALAFLHAKGICHRDLKPTNVLLDPSGQPLLLDFNLSADGRLPPGRLGGTLPYMGPEHLRTMMDPRLPPPGPESDIFALGVIAHELLTGQHPFGPVPPTAPLILLSALLLERQEHGPANRLGGRVEPAVAGLIARCLAANPAERPTAAELEKAARAYLAPVRRCRRWLTRRPGMALALGVLMLGLFSGGVFRVRDAVWAAPAPVTGKAAAQELYELGRRSLLKENDPIRAENYFRDSIRHWSDGRAEACLAWIDAKQKQHAAAIDKCLLAINRGYNSARLYNNLGYSCLLRYEAGLNGPKPAEAKRWFDEADQYFSKAIELDPNLQAPRYNRAMLALSYHNDTGAWPPPRPDRAVEDMQKALSVKPVNSRLAYNAGLLFCLASAQQDSLKIASLDALCLARELGYQGDLKTDLSFISLRNDPEFQTVATMKPKKTPPTIDIRLIDPALENAH